MWYEFPKAENLFDLNTQFMFGEQILVCPKLIEPSEGGALWDVTCDMPLNTNWYYWYNRVSQEGGQKSLQLPDYEQGIFVRGGSIIPILQHSTEMSLFHALGNHLTLEVYPDQAQEAEGKLYLDDG